jgi:4-alpha-glucanotransferase
MMQRLAGLMIPLFSLRTADDLGRGEIGGLVPMADFALATGHRMLQLLPTDETAPGETSPYSAMSVLAIDPLYISLRGLGGSGDTDFNVADRGAGGIDVADVSAVDRTGDRSAGGIDAADLDTIRITSGDRAAGGIDAADLDAARVRVGWGDPTDNVGPGDQPDHLKLQAEKMKLLRKLFDRCVANASTSERSAFDDFQHRNDHWLRDYTLFRALKERFRWSEWATWPDRLDRHEPAALERAARELATELSFYAYVQFVAHRQWSEMRTELARRGVLLGGDLAFSPGRESAEVWANQQMFDLTRTVGAPPDAFSATGQRWGLPMPDWAQMRATGFSLIRTRVRHARELFDLLRIDHVVGLFRTFAFGADPKAPGAFDPPDELAQLAQGEEIIRAAKEEGGPLQIFAEDLGVIPPFVRIALTELGLPGYRVMRWERHWDAPGQPFIKSAAYPELSVATTGTHDTDTMAEWWRAAATAERLQFVESLGGNGINVKLDYLDERAIDAIIGSLYSAPSRIAITPVQDLFGWDARINTPGTVNDANWKWRLPFSLDRFARDSKIVRRAAALRAIAARCGRI